MCAKQPPNNMPGGKIHRLLIISNISLEFLIVNNELSLSQALNHRCYFMNSANHFRMTPCLFRIALLFECACVCVYLTNKCGQLTLSAIEIAKLFPTAIEQLKHCCDFNFSASLQRNIEILFNSFLLTIDIYRSICWESIYWATKCGRRLLFDYITASRFRLNWSYSDSFIIQCPCFYLFMSFLFANCVVKFQFPSLDNNRTHI